MNFPWDKLEFKKVDPDQVIRTDPVAVKEGVVITPFTGSLPVMGGINIIPAQLEYEIKSYPDGAKYVVVKKIYHNLTFRLNSYEDLWILGQIHDVVKAAGWSITVTIPFLIDSQADRRFDIDQPHGLKLVCNFLNGLTNFNYKVFHPHNGEVVEALLDRVEIVDNSDFIYKVVDLMISSKFGDKYDSFQKSSLLSNMVLMSSDAGGFKSLMKLADKIGWEGETFSASKSRKYEKGKSRLIQQIDRQDFEGKDILIVDDICVYGGTFKGLAKMLKERNCGKLYLAVSHMTVQDLGDDPVTDYFDKIYTTNSKYSEYFEDSRESNITARPKNLNIIKLF